jgi:hypothetical protein
MTYVSASLRRSVIQRANNCCEYCLVSQEDRFLPYEVDHIIAEKHGGATTEDNLCWSCYICNGFKGSDLSSVDWDDTGDIVPLFNPRKSKWTDHFRINGTTIEPLAPTGRVTVFLLRLNTDEQKAERELLVPLGHYPCLGSN